MGVEFSKSRGIFSGVGVITLAVVVTVMAASVFLHVRCANDFWDAANVYPNAQLIESESNFLGLQRVVYHSNDAPEAVQDWYRTQVAQQSAEQMREAVTSGDFRGVKQTAPFWTITPDAERGGSSIILAVVCPSGTPPL